MLLPTDINEISFVKMDVLVEMCKKGWERAILLKSNENYLATSILVKTIVDMCTCTRA
jgi:hypothetical protein